MVASAFIASSPRAVPRFLRPSASTLRSRSRCGRMRQPGPTAPGIAARSPGDRCTPGRPAGPCRRTGRGRRTRAGRTGAGRRCGGVISRHAILPPGRRTRASSTSPASRSGTLRMPKPTVTASKLSSVNGSAVTSREDPLDCLRLPARPLEHPLREIDSCHAPAGPLGGESKVACAATRVEHLCRPAHDRLRRDPPPAPVEAHGHRAVHRVVHRRDPVEHHADLRRGKHAAAHSCPHRLVSLFSIPSWSRHLPTTNSIRSSMVSGAL